MATATASKKQKPATPAESLRDMEVDITAEAAADWRRWAVALADGQGAPAGRELLAVAAALKIQDPANELQSAADAVLEVRTMTRGLDACERELAEKLAPYGGELATLLQARDRAKAEVERLEGLVYDAYNQGNRAYYVSCIHQARRRHPHVWPDYAVNGKAEVL